MVFSAELTDLSREELIALVQQLRQQLTDREQEIDRLQGLVTEQAVAAEALSLVSTEPGSREDLFAQLDKIYPGSG
jgi:prefoldin subunit 5